MTSRRVTTAVVVLLLATVATTALAAGDATSATSSIEARSATARPHWPRVSQILTARKLTLAIDRQAPKAPARLGVSSVSTATITVTWAASQDNVAISGYGIYVNGARIARTTAKSYKVSALTCGTTYKLGVDAYDGVGNRSAISSILAATAPCVDSAAPTSPKDIRQASWSQTGVGVQWSAASDDVGVAGYSVYRDGVPVTTTQQTTTWIGGLVCGAGHSISVDAFDAAGNRSPRATAVVNTTACADTTAPSAPRNLTVSGATSSTIAVAWEPSTDDTGVAGYRVSLEGIDLHTTTGTTAAFGGLACGRSYTVKVTAADAAGNVSPSASLSVSTAPCPASGSDTQAPTTPTGLVRRDGSSASVTLAWSASSDNIGVAGYGIYRAGSKVAESKVTAFELQGLACATSYSLAVDAVDVSGLRSARAPITATTEPCADTQPPPAPTGLTAQAKTETSVTLTWQGSTGASGYRVFRDGAVAGTTSSNGYTISSLTCGKSYTFGVEAYDGAGNHSARTATIVSTSVCSDTVAPSAPSSFVKTGATTTSIAVSWSPASDNVAVAGYALSVAGAAIGTTAQPSYTFSGLSCGTSYSLGIEAYDAAGNRSPRITLQADAAACASSPPTAPSPPSSEVLANVFAVPPTSTDGSTNCVRSATPKTYEQALAASPKNVCAYVAGVKTSWDMACNAATAGDVVGVRPGVYETVGDGGYLLGSNEIGQDCSDGLGADVNPNAKEQGVPTGTTAAWVKFVPAVPCNGVPNISFKYMPGVLSMANGNWHLIVEGDCFNFNRTIYIHDRNQNFGPNGRPSNLIIRGESQTRLQQWYGLEVRGGRNMLFENIDQGPNVQCAANDPNATPVYFRCLPPELGGAYFEAPYAASGTNAPGCNPNETDLCAGFYPRGGGEQVEPYIHGGAGYGTYSNIRFQTYHLHDGQAKGTGAGVHPGCFMFDGNKGNGDLPPHNMVFDGVRCERQVIGVQHQDGGVTVQNSVFACPVVDLPQTTPQRGRWDQCAAQPSVGIALRGDQPQTIMKNVLYRNNVFLPNPNVFNPTANNAGLLLQLGGAFGTGFENVRIVGNIFYGANLQGCDFAGVTCADNAFLNAPSVGARPTTLTCNPFVDAEQGTPDDLWREKTQVDPRLSAACNVPTVSLVGDLNLDHDADGDPRTNPTHVGADH